MIFSQYIWNELITFVLLLLFVVLVYFLLKWHYIFAFGLLKKTSVYEKNKNKIEKIRKYFFIFLKFTLFMGLLSMFLFCSTCIVEKKSLLSFIIAFWSSIPEGFWLQMLWTLVRIAILIIVMRYVLKIVYKILEKQEEKSLLKKRYNTKNVEMLYVRIHNTIKYTVILGVVYRIIHFFPFLEEVSYVFLVALILFFILAIMITMKELISMIQTRK